MNFYGILSYLSLFLPAFTLLRRHTSTFVLYMRRKAPAHAVSSGGQAGSARNKRSRWPPEPLLLPCLSHVPHTHTFSLSSARCHTSKVILHRTTKVILLFSFYFPSPPLMFNVYPCFVLLFLLFLLSRVLAVRFVSVRWYYIVSVRWYYIVPTRWY